MGKNAINVLNEGNKSLDEINGKLKQTIDNVLAINDAALKVGKNFFNVKSPQGLNDSLKTNKTYVDQLNVELKERQRLEKALEVQLARNAALESNNAIAVSRAKFETQQLNKANREAAILSSTLATEYQKLVVKMNQAGATVQSLTAKRAQGISLSNKEQSELKQSSTDFARYQKAVLKADESIGRFQRNVGNYGSAIGKAGSALRNFAGAFGAFSASLIAREIFTSIKEIDGLDKALKQVTETTIAFNQAQGFIKSLADEAGVDINTLQKAYTKFFASAKTTNLTLAETQNIFRQTAKAGAVLGLSTDDINGSLKALEQILSKGKVQAEEIRGQLGERLPGAFQILAKSMGLTTAELSKQLELGNVISDEVLPGFAKELEKTYSLDTVLRVNTIEAAQNRLSNAWREFIANTGESNKINEKLISILEFLAKNLDSILSVIISLTKLFVAYKVVVTTINLVSGAWAAINGAVKLSLTALNGGIKAVIVSLRAMKIATAATGIGLFLVALGGAYEIWQSFKDGAKEATKAQKDFNDEIERMERLTDRFTNALNNVKEGRQRANAAVMEQILVEDRLADKLRDQGVSEAKIREAIKLTTSVRTKDVKEINNQIDTAATFTESQKRSIRIAITAYQVLDEIINKNLEIANSEDKKNEENKKTLSALENSIAWLKKQIDVLEEQQSKLATNSKEWQAYQEKIDEATFALKRFQDIFEGLTIEGVSESFSIDFQEVDLNKAFDSFEKFQKELKEKEQIKFIDYDSINKDLEEWSNRFTTAEEKRREEARKTKELREKYEQEFADSSLELVNTIFDGKIQKYDDEIQKNNDYYAALLDNENLSEEQRSEMEAKRDRKNSELEKKKREEQRKQAIFNKITALANIGINIAEAISKTLGQTGFLGIPLTTIVAAMGAAQVATVLATPIPKYEKGKGEYDNYEGAAIWGEKRREAKISKDGTVELSPTTIGNHLTHVKADDIIHPDANKFLSSLSDKELYNNVHKYTILANVSNQNETLNAYLMAQSVERGISRQTDRIVNALSKKNTKIHLHNNNSVGDDLSFLLRKQNTL